MNYDCIIVGDELSGLVAGASLIKRGFRVLLVRGPWGPPPPLRALPLPTGPIAALFEKLRIAERLTVPQPDEILFQQISPAGRLDWYHYRPHLIGDLRREFGDDAGTADSFLNEIIEMGHDISNQLSRLPLLFTDGFFARRRMHRDVAGILPALAFAEPPAPAAQVLKAWRSMLFFGSYAPAQLPNAFAAVLCYHLMSGVSHQFLYASTLQQLLRQRIEEARGAVMDEMRVTGLVLDGATVAGVQWGPREHFFAGQTVLWTAPPEALINSLAENWRKKKRAKALLGQAPESFWATIRLPVARELLPAGLAHRAVLETGAAETPPIVLLHEAATSDRAEEILNVSFQVRQLPDDEAARSGKLYQEAEKALAQVKRLAPFAPVPDSRQVAGDLPRTLFPVHAVHADCPLGLTCRWPLTDLKGVFLGGPQIWPALGPFGELLLGGQLAALVTHHLTE